MILMRSEVEYLGLVKAFESSLLARTRRVRSMWLEESRIEKPTKFGEKGKRLGELVL